MLAQSPNAAFYWGFGIFSDNSGATVIHQINYTQDFSVKTDMTSGVYDSTQYNTYAIAEDATSTSSANNYIWVNGDPQAIHTTPDQGFIGSATAYLNGNGNSIGSAPGSSFGMTLCELLVYNGVVTPSDGTNVINYLKDKWGTQ